MYKRQHCDDLLLIATGGDEALLRQLKHARPKSVWLAATMPRGGADARRLARLHRLAAAVNIPPVSYTHLDVYKRQPFLMIAAPLMLAGCSLAPKTALPPPPVPQGWPVGDAYLIESEAALPILSYKQLFTDARLQSLVEQALANNRDLRTAYALSLIHI